MNNGNEEMEDTQSEIPRHLLPIGLNRFRDTL